MLYCTGIAQFCSSYTDQKRLMLNNKEMPPGGYLNNSSLSKYLQYSSSK